MPDPQTISMHDEERMIPVWSIIAAGVAFVLVEYYFWVLLPEHRHHAPPPLGMRIYLDLTWGAVAALYFLMVGYISKDAPRRAMSTWFWMFICVVAPPGIGAVLYFLLRQPEVSNCSACGTQVQGDFHFCPQCNYQLLASCGNCYRTVRATDQFCTRCGHELAADHMPARLRVMSE
jgi:hypothetical protein